MLIIIIDNLRRSAHCSKYDIAQCTMNKTSRVVVNEKNKRAFY